MSGAPVLVADPLPATLSVEAAGRRWDIEHVWVGPARSAHPPVVFLHEGLGSVSMWRGFPAAFCTAFGLRGFVYSRPGYGGSTPKPPDERWTPDFMHVQAREVLPRVLEAAGIERPWLFGHSDGASIALLHAGRFDVAGLVLMAPHCFVEAVSIDSIEEARVAYAAGELRTRLARHHADVDSAFRGWNDAWLSPAFRDWNIVAELPAIRCPVLAIQGEGDVYGTLEQIRVIERALPGKTRLLVLAECGHSPHRDQAAAVIAAAGDFIVGAGSPAAARTPRPTLRTDTPQEPHP